jgi:hypothetical protein
MRAGAAREPLEPALIGHGDEAVARDATVASFFVTQNLSEIEEIRTAKERSPLGAPRP